MSRKLNNQGKKRSFGGKIDNFIDRNERAFEQKHLKTYLKGHKRFQIGKYPNGEPMYSEVKEIWL